MEYEVISFTSDSNGAFARVRMPQRTAKGKLAWDWLPWGVHADTPEEAAEKAQAFLLAERERLAVKEQNMAAARAKAAATRRAKAPEKADA